MFADAVLVLHFCDTVNRAIQVRERPTTSGGSWVITIPPYLRPVLSLATRSLLGLKSPVTWDATRAAIESLLPSDV